MKIGFVSTPIGWGGGENMLAQLIVGLRRRGEQVFVAAPGESPLADWARREQIELLPQRHRGRTPAEMWRLRRWFATHDLEIALLNDPHAITYGGLALAGAGVPRVGVRHTVFPVRSAWKHQRLVERVVAVSEAARKGCLAAGVSSDHVDVIHGGVDPLASDPQAIETARKQFQQASTTGPHLLAVGSLLPVKGFDTLIRATAQQVASGRPWTLWIAGEGPEREKLEALAADLGVTDRVRLLGFRDDIGVLLAAADGFVSASHNEGLSLVIIEAMLAETPIAATPVGGAREVLGMGQRDTTSRFAETFAPGDVAGACRAIRAALSHSGASKDRLAAAAGWAKEHFSLDRMASDFETLFETLLTPSRANHQRAA